jgi:hypothetical protein
MNAATIVELADEEDTSAVARALGCSVRQAKEVTALARRAFAGGYDLPPEMIPHGTVSISKAAHPAGRHRVVTDAEARQLAQAIDPPEMHSYEAQAAEQRRAILEKNVANGYREWEHELERMRNAG